MTRSEAIVLIHQQLGFRSDLADRIIPNLTAAQTMLEAGPTKPWFLISEDSYVRTTADEDRVPIPSDFIQEVDEAVLRYVPDDSEEEQVDLKKDYYDTLRVNYAEVEAGAPEAYCLMGEYFRIFPMPDDDYLIRMIYYKKDTVLTTDVENGWLKHVPFLLVGKAGGMIASAVRDSAALATFMKWEQEGRVLLVSQNADRDMAGRDMQMGGPE